MYSVIRRRRAVALPPREFILTLCPRERLKVIAGDRSGESEREQSEMGVAQDEVDADRPSRREQPDCGYGLVRAGSGDLLVPGTQAPPAVGGGAGRRAAGSVYAQHSQTHKAFQSASGQSSMQAKPRLLPIHSTCAREHVVCSTTNSDLF